MRNKYIFYSILILVFLATPTFAFVRLNASSPILSSSRSTIKASSPLLTSSRWYVDTLPKKYFNGLVGYYPFNGNDLLQNVADESGQGNSMMLIGVATTTAAQVGMVGGSFQFTGGSDYATSSLTNLTNFPTGNNAWTFSFWARFDKSQSGQRLIFIYGIDGAVGGSNNIYLDVNNTSGCAANKIGVGVWGSADSICQTNALTYGTTWYYVTVTHTSAPLTTLYINAVSQGTDAVTNYNIRTNYFNIARYDGGANTAATFDDFRVYNRALTANEVLDLYHSVYKFY